MSELDCPSADDLKAFVLGDLPEGRCEWLGKHLEACPRCEALTQEMDQLADPLMQALRQGESLIRNRSARRSRELSVTEAEVPRAERDLLRREGEEGGRLPERVAGYTILAELGRGGMGVVYKARQTRLGRVVALKMILHAGHATASELVRFRVEAQAIARLQHPHIVQVHEVGEDEGKPFFSLEYCGGGSLGDKLKGTPLPPQEAAQLVQTLAQAMQAAHEKNVIHRDLKPANILLTEDGTPKISDFGLAKNLDDTGHTGSGAVLGTPSYMAPEQADGKSKDLGPACDIYALGALLYECLTGRPPFRAATPLDTVLQVVNAEAVPPTQLNPGVPRDLETICLKCLHKEPDKRYGSAAALAEDLGRFQADEPIFARPVSRPERAWRWCRRNPTVALLLVTVTATLVLGTTVAAWFAVAAEEERQRALDEKRDAVAARAQSEKDRDLARQAEAEGREKLLQAHLAEARARRFSGQPGQRFQSLEALAQAVELARRLNKPASLFDDMRNLAIISLALPDFHLEKEWLAWPEGRWGPVFDDRLSSYAYKDPKGNVIVCRRADDVELARLPNTGARKWGPCTFGQGELRSHLVLYDEFDHVLMLWNFATNELTRLAQTEAFRHWHLSADGQRLVLIEANGRLKVFELPSGRHLHAIRFGRWAQAGAADTEAAYVHTHPFRHQLAITMGTYGSLERETVYIVDLDSGMTTELRKPGDVTYGVAWYADGVTLAVGYQRGIEFWDVAERRVLPGSLTPNGGAMNVSINRTGELLLSHADWGGGTKLWHPQTHRLLLSMPADDVFWSESTSEGQLYYHRLDGPRLRQWVIDPARECRTLVRDSRRVPPREHRTNAIHREGRLAAVGTSTGVTLLDLATALDVGHLNVGHNWNVAFDPASGDLLTCNPRGAHRWPVRAVPDAPGRWRIGPPQRLPIAPRNADHEIRISANGKVLGVARGDTVQIIHEDQPDRPIALTPLEDIRGNFALSPDGQWVATGRHGGHGGDVRVWNARDGKLVKSFGIHTAFRVAFSPDGKWLLACDLTQYYFWRVGTWETGPQQRLQGVCQEYAFSPDSRLLALERGDGAMRLIEVASGRELAVLEDPQQGRSVNVTFSPDGMQLLLTNGDYQVLRLWDLRRLRQGLKPLGLDWEAPPYPAAVDQPPVVEPLLLEVDLGSEGRPLSKQAPE